MHTYVYRLKIKIYILSRLLTTFFQRIRTLSVRRQICFISWKCQTVDTWSCISWTGMLRTVCFLTWPFNTHWVGCYWPVFPSLLDVINVSEYTETCLWIRRESFYSHLCPYIWYWTADFLLSMGVGACYPSSNFYHIIIVHHLKVK